MKRVTEKPRLAKIVDPFFWPAFLGEHPLCRHADSALHGRPWLPSPLRLLVNRIGLQLYMRPVDASVLAGPDGICGLMPAYPGGLWVPALPQAFSTPV